MLLSKLKIALAVLMLAGLTTLCLVSLAGLTAVAQPAGETKVAERPAKTEAAAEDALTWEVQTTLKGHKNRVESIAFSPDGKVLATASYDETVKLWNVTTGRLLRTLEGQEGEVHQVAFAPDGKTVATAGKDKTARVWDVATGQSIQQVTHADEVYSVAFTRDGKALLVGGGLHDSRNGESRGELRLWDPATGKEITNVGQSHKNRVVYLAFSADGKTLITGGHDNTIKVWEWDSKDQLKEKQSVEVGQTQGIYGLGLSPDGKTVAVSCDGGTIKLYDVATGKQRDDLEKIKEGRWDQLTFSPDGKVLASNYWIQERDGDFMVTRRSRIRFWDVATGKVLQTVEVKEVIESVAFAPDGKTLAAGGRGKHKYPAPAGEVIRLKVDDIQEEKDGPVLLLTPKKSSPEKK